jgi:DNA-binding response OmpR family regulator
MESIRELASEEQLQDGPSRTRPEPRLSKLRPNGAKMRILVVEDERLARSALRSILELDGYKVRAAGDGSRAVKLMTGFDPHLIIMDWRLPGLSGERLCREIHRRKPDVPIIVVSSSDEAFKSRVEVSARLRKPLDVRRLRAAVEARRPDVIG